ncbi:MAG TPA: hypothetical protein VF395_07620, partial [Polyangiaceae bacterium]
MREHLDELLPKLSSSVLEGIYEPGNIRRAWIPKAGGGERGLGIPDVVDRMVQEAVRVVLTRDFRWIPDRDSPQLFFCAESRTRAPAAMNLDGIIHFQGAVGNFVDTNASSQILRLPELLRPVTLVYVPVDL